MARQNIIGTIYLLHFSRPFKHAKHYSGWTQDLKARLALHAQGRGAKLLAAVTAVGITWELADTIEGDRHLERRLKQHGAARRCPICRAQAKKEVTQMYDKNWRARAACREGQGVDPEIFFPLGDMWRAGEDAQAKAVCKRCPVVAECLDWALETGEPWGVAGGLTEVERQVLRRKAS